MLLIKNRLTFNEKHVPIKINVNFIYRIRFYYNIEVGEITIRDVARLSGFSVTTISHIVNAIRFVEGDEGENTSGN